MIGILVAAAPLTGMGTTLLVSFYCALQLLGFQPLESLAVVSTFAVGGVAGAVLGHYIAISSGVRGNERLYARAGALLAVGLLVSDQSILDSLVVHAARETQSVMSWQTSARVGMRCCLALCKVTCALSVILLMIEVPLHVLGPRGKSEGIRVLAALRPFLIIGFFGLASRYIEEVWFEVFNLI